LLYLSYHCQDDTKVGAKLGVITTLRVIASYLKEMQLTKIGINYTQFAG